MRWICLTPIGGRPKPEWCFCRGSCGELSCPRSATASHSGAADRAPNLPVGRRTPYHWAKSFLCIDKTYLENKKLIPSRLASFTQNMKRLRNQAYTVASQNYMTILAS